MPQAAMLILITAQPLISFSFLLAPVSQMPNPELPAIVFLPLTMVMLVYGVFMSSSLVHQHNRSAVLFWCYIIAAHLTSVIITYAQVYKYLGLMEGASPVTEVSDFIYFSVVTWTTLGYGDIVPAPRSRLFAASEALYGHIAMTLYLALIFQVMSVRRDSHVER